MSALDDLLAALDGPVQRLIDAGHEPADDLLDTLVDPDPRARTVPGIGRVVEPPITGPAVGDRRVRVHRVIDQGRPRWRAVLRDDEGDEHVGLYDDQPTAVMRGITALRFVAAGVPWRAEQ